MTFGIFFSGAGGGSSGGGELLTPVLMVDGLRDLTGLSHLIRCSGERNWTGLQ